MKKLLVLALVGPVVVMAAAPARAGSACRSTVMEFEEQFPAVLREAGSPRIRCDVDLDVSGRYFPKRNRIDLGRGGSYGRRLAHEIGHAWIRHAVVADPSWKAFGVLRGFPSGTSVDVLIEDHAEVFAFVLGDKWWKLSPSDHVDAPYGFRNKAGRPTPDEISDLVAAGWLPIDTLVSFHS